MTISKQLFLDLYNQNPASAFTFLTILLDITHKTDKTPITLAPIVLKHLSI